MKAKGLSVLTLALAISGCASEPGANYINKDDILGAWNCNYKTSREENGVTSTVIMETKESYLRNGRVNAFGVMKVKISPEFPEIQYSLAGTATWKLNGKYLIQEATDIKLVNLTHPQLDSIIKMQDMFPSGMSDSSEIIKLTQNEMTLRSESTNEVYKCNKAF